MKRLLILLSLVTVQTYTLANYCWVQRTSVGTTMRNGGMGFSINGKGYVGGGWVGGVAQSDMWEYDHVTDAWTQKANKPGIATWAAACFAVNGKGYFSIGYNGSSYPTATYEFDPVANVWTLKAPFPAAGRQDVGSFSANNYGFVVGGFGAGTNYYNQLYRYDPTTDSWSAQASYPGPARDGMRSFVLNNIAYLCGGYASGISTTDVYAYNALTNFWTVKAPLPGPGRHSLSAFDMNGLGFAGNGRIGAGGYLNDFYEYNPVSDSWMAIPNFPGQPLGYPVTFTVGNGGYISTGRFNSSTNSNQTWMLSYTADASFTVDTSQCSLTVEFTNTSTSGVNYNWNFGDGNSSVTTNPIHTYSTSGTYTVTLVAGIGNCADTSIVQVTIGGTISSSATLTTDCNNTLTISNFSTNATGVTWLWGDGLQTIGVANSHTYATSGNYTVLLILSNGSCLDTVSYQITIQAQPVAAFSATAGCNLEVMVNDTSQNSNTFLWDWGNGIQTSGTTSSYQYSSPGTYTITLIAYNGSCSDTTTQVVTIGPPVVASFSYTPDCNLGISVLNNSTNASIFTWLWGDGTSNSAPTPYHTYNAPGTYQVSLIASDGVCSDTGFITVTVDTFPVSAINFSYSECRDTVYLNSVYTSTSYSWNLGNGQTSGSPSISQYYSIAGSYTVTLMNTNSYCIDSSQVTVNVSIAPTANFSHVVSCDGILMAVADSNSQWSYQWSTGDGGIYSSASINHQYFIPGEYTVLLTVDNGYCTRKDSVTTEYSLQNVYQVINEIDSCSGTVMFAVLPDSLSSILWYFGDGSTSNGNNVSHTFTFPSVYNVTAIVNAGTACPDTVITQLDLNNSNFGSLFIPNCFTPNGDRLNDYFEIKTSACDFESITIFDRWGLNVFKSVDTHFKWDGTSNGSKLPAGVYVYILKTGRKLRSGTITLIR